MVKICQNFAFLDQNLSVLRPKKLAQMITVTLFPDDNNGGVTKKEVIIRKDVHLIIYKYQTVRNVKMNRIWKNGVIGLNVIL